MANICRTPDEKSFSDDDLVFFSTKLYISLLSVSLFEKSFFLTLTGFYRQRVLSYYFCIARAYCLFCIFKQLLLFALQLSYIVLAVIFQNSTVFNLTKIAV